jgi:SAM-dependent methyltransferase
MSSAATAERPPVTLVSVPCPRCGGTKSVQVARGKDRLCGIPGEYYAAECCGCGLWFQNPRPPLDRLGDLYPQDYLPHASPQPAALRRGAAEYLRRHLGYAEIKPDAEAGFQWTALPVFSPVRRWLTGVNLTPRYVPGGKLLEIGCASGARLLYLRRLGWEKLYGIELMPAAAAQARESGFEVVSGQIEKNLSAYPDGFFDAVVSSMVFEHLADPFAVVAEIAKKLKPGGELLFSTIVRNSLDHKLFGDYWGGFDFPRHMVHFSLADITGMLKDRFEEPEWFYQSAPADFSRPAAWRLGEGTGGVLDRAAVRLAASRPGEVTGFFLAKLGLTCRVSFRCRRKA